MILQLHSYWAILTLAILLFGVINFTAAYLKKRDYKTQDLRISLFVLIFAHIQLLIGLAYYFTSPAYKHLKEIGMSAGMKDAHLRMLTIEHPITMILAIVLITIGFSRHKKKKTSQKTFQTLAIYYGLALILILSRIPWGQWFEA